MIKVGISGNRYSGKSTICKMFKQISIPVFDADTVLKFILGHEITIVNEIRKNVGTQIFKSPEFKNLICGEVYKEKAIRYKNNLRYIDVLVKSDVDATWNVIDYKSSLSYSEHHLKQVRYYNKAVNAITGENVEGYLCYLLSDEVKLVKV